MRRIGASDPAVISVRDAHRPHADEPSLSSSAQLSVASRELLYALPGEEWRIKAYLLVDDIYASLVPGWRPDLERVIGALLGYEREATERFLAYHGFVRPEVG